MADNRNSQLNLSALQRLDSSISSIIDSASQVALYKFSSENNEWEKTEIEGSLFVYMRSRCPQHGIVVINRVSTTNFIESITTELEFHIQIPFLLYRNGKGNIHGIWFYEQEQCIKIARLLNGLSQLTQPKKRLPLEKPKQQPPQQKSNSYNLKQMDIMSLLSRAQEEYDKRCPRKESPTNVQNNFSQGGILRPMALRSNGFSMPNGSSVPISVDKLFAQAGDGKHVFIDYSKQNPSRSRSYSSTNSTKPLGGEDILQRLMSGGGQNVKKGHRARSATYSSEPIAFETQTSVEMVELDLKKKLNILPLNSEQNEFPHKESLYDWGKDVSRTDAVDIPILTPAMLEMSSSLPTSSSSPMGFHHGSNLCDESYVASSFPKTNLPKPPSPIPLLSPMDFKIKNSSSSLDESPPSPPLLGASFGNNHNHTPKKPLSVTPLTKEQLREALCYMIQNDDKFVNEVHECYLKSLQSQLNGYKSS